MQTLSSGLCDLVPWPRIEPRIPALVTQSLSHWTTREVSASVVSWSGCLSNSTHTTFIVMYPRCTPSAVAGHSEEERGVVDPILPTSACILINHFACLWLVNFLVILRDLSTFDGASLLSSSHPCRGFFLLILEEKQALRHTFLHFCRPQTYLPPHPPSPLYPSSLLG